MATAISKVGVLHLPKKYRSAFIIDGQHRLYGYAGTKYAKTNTIPVVAFVNLARGEQVEIFIQINENQKAVPKTLRETLNADSLWGSDNKKEQLRALSSRISIFLGEENDSPFCDYISLGEDNRVLTPGNISAALLKSAFFGIVTKDSIEKLGLFYKGDMDKALATTYEFLRLSFIYLVDNLKEDWKLGRDSFLFINKGIYGVIRLLSDIVEYLESSGDIDTGKNSSLEMFSEAQKYLDPLIIYVKDMDESTILKFRDMKGSTAPVRYWRRFQACVRSTYSGFNPEGLEAYMENEERALNNQTFEMIKDIEIFMGKDFKKRLLTRHGDDWAWKKGVPVKVQEASEKLMREKNRSRKQEDETDGWDNLNLIHYQEIARQNWAYMDEDNKRVQFFEAEYTLPGEENLNKDDTLKWWVKLNDARNIVSHVSSDQISEDDFEYVQNIHQWLVKKVTRNKWQQPE